MKELIHWLRFALLCLSALVICISLLTVLINLFRLRSVEHESMNTSHSRLKQGLHSHKTKL